MSSNLVRFGVSIDSRLLKRFDDYVTERKYLNRSEAIRDMIRDSLVRDEWIQDCEIAGTISIVYGVEDGALLSKLTLIQREFSSLILASLKVRLDTINMMETVTVKGISASVHDLHNRIKACKGIKHVQMVQSTLGEAIE